jgi:hypothetical protein
MEKSRAKGKTPILKSKYRLGTLWMSKPVLEIYINHVVYYTGKVPKDQNYLQIWIFR